MSDKNDLYWRDYEYQQNAFRERDWQNYLPVQRDEAASVPKPVSKMSKEEALQNALRIIQESSDLMESQKKLEQSSVKFREWHEHYNRMKDEFDAMKGKG
jgi:hypothetical protein